MNSPFKTFKHRLKKRKHHIGYTASALIFLGLGLTLAQNDILPTKETVPSQPTAIEEEPFFEEDFVDPREIENTLRDLTRMKSEARGFVKRAAKLPEIKQRAEEIIKEIDGYIANIKNSPADYTKREALQEFYDARMWDEMNKVRAQLDLPQMLKEFPLAVKRVERLLKLKTYQKLGLDIAIIKNYLLEAKESYTEAQASYKAGDWEEAMATLQFMQESGHPGELEGAIRRFKEISDQVKSLRDKEIKTKIGELILPIAEAINEGDFRNAQQLINDIQPELMSLIKKSYKMDAKKRAEILKQLSAFEEKVNNKLENWEEEKMMKEKVMEEKAIEEKPVEPSSMVQPKPQENKTQPAPLPVEIKPAEPTPANSAVSPTQEPTGEISN